MLLKKTQEKAFARFGEQRFFTYDVKTMTHKENKFINCTSSKLKNLFFLIFLRE